MESIGVLMVKPMSPYLESELSSRFNLYKLWDFPSPSHLLSADSDGHLRRSIRAAVCCATAGVDADLIDSLPNLEIISSYSVGIDKINLAKCRERGVRVTNTPDVLTDDVADLALGLALATLRRICDADRFVRSGSDWKNGDYGLTTKVLVGFRIFCDADRFVRCGDWRKADYGLTAKFSGKSVGIIGLGRIGSAIAKRARAFGCTISYHSRTRKPSSGYKYYESVTELASNSDVLFVSCSLTNETRGIVNRQVIDALGPRGVLVNVGRGAHVDEAELVSALAEGRLGGAGLDVFKSEPDVPRELFGMGNVVAQSHVGSDTDETCEAMADLVLGNLEAHFRKLPLLTPVVW